MTAGVLGAVSSLVASSASALTNYDNFGSALAHADFNGDGITDMAVGSPMSAPKGDVTIVYGGGKGTITFSPDSAGLGREGTVGAFGSALAAGDFNADGAFDLAIGNFTDTCSGHLGAGSVTVLYGQQNVGLSVTKSQRYTQDTAEVTGSACENSDFFGFALVAADFTGDGADDLVVSAPYEDIGAVSNAGLVVFFAGRKSTSTTFNRLGYYSTYHQDLEGLETTAAAGDRFGAALAAGRIDGNSVNDLVIGIPGEQADNPVATGAIEILYGTGWGFILQDAFHQLVHQFKPGINEDGTAGDRFGEALAVGQFDGERGWIAVGLPGRKVGSSTTAGAVHMLAGSTASGGLIDTSRDFMFTQDTNDASRGGAVAGTAEVGDEFGRSFAVGDFDADGKQDLAVQSYEYSLPQGAWYSLQPGLVHVFEGASTGLTFSNDVSFDLTNLGATFNDYNGIDRFGFSMVAYQRSGDAATELVVGSPSGGSGAVGHVAVLKGVKQTTSVAGGVSTSGASRINAP